MRRICSWHECRAPFEAERDDKRFCSDNCRAKANKAKRKGEEVPVAPQGSPVPTAAVAPPPASPRPERAPAAANEPPPPPVTKRARDDHDFAADQGDYNPERPDTLPGTAVGRIARLEDRLRDLEQDFDLAEPDRSTWVKLRPKVETLLARPASTGPTSEQITTLVRNELNATLKGWRDRIVAQDQAIAELRGEVGKIGERVSGMKSAAISVAAPPPPPPQAPQVVPGTDRRVLAKLGEFEQSLAGVQQRLDSVESDVAEAWQAIVRQASGADDADEDDDAA